MEFETYAAKDEFLQRLSVLIESAEFVDYSKKFSDKKKQKYIKRLKKLRKIIEEGNEDELRR